MTDPRKGVEDAQLRRYVRRTLGADTAPAHLVEAVREAAIRGSPRAPRPAGFWTELLPPLLGLGLVLALLAGSAKHLGFSGGWGEHGASPGFLAGLLIPFAVLVLMEVARGAPTLREWWR